MAYMPHAFQVHVGAAKAGIDMMMKNLALEWGPYGIRSNSIVPGPIEGTEGMKRLAGSAHQETLINSVPLRRMGTVDDIGQTEDWAEKVESSRHVLEGHRAFD